MKDPKYLEILISNQGHTSDSANHTTYYKLMQLILGEDHIDTRYLYFEKTTGLARRHPDRGTDDFTRDQFTPFLTYELVSYMVENGSMDISLEYLSGFRTYRFYELVRRNFFFFNTVKSNGVKKKWYEKDFLDPQTRALEARCSSEKRWLQYIGDINILLTILHKNWFKPYHNQDENIHCHLIAARLDAPTFIGNFAWNYYFKKTKKLWYKKLFDFFDRNGTYYPEIPPIAIKAILKLDSSLWNTELMLWYSEKYNCSPLVNTQG